MEAAMESMRAHRVADAGAKLEAGDDRENDLLAVIFAEGFCAGQHGRNDAGAVMRH